MNEARGRLQAMTLVEGLFYMVLSLVVLSALYLLFSRSVFMQDRTFRSQVVQADVRRLLERIGRDVRQALWFLRPDSGRGEVLAVAVPLDDEEALERSMVSQDGFPFVFPGRDASYSLPACRISYVYRPDRQIVERQEAEGELRMAVSGEKGFLSSLEFAPEGEVRSKRLAANVERFDTRLYAYDEGGGGWKALEDGADAASYTDAVFVLVDLECRYSEGIYGRGGAAESRAPSLHVVTRFFSYKRSRGLVLGQWFSSLDRDFRY